jgi:hypothetical protein
MADGVGGVREVVVTHPGAEDGLWGDTGRLWLLSEEVGGEHGELLV